MTPKPQRGTPDGDATLAIQKLARETGGDVQELQTLYVLEALLARIGAPPHQDKLVLKGRVLLATFAARRPSRCSRQKSQLRREPHTLARGD